MFQLKQAMDKEGLGYNAINSDSIQREEAEDMIRSYAASNSVEDLVFSSELAFEERKEIAMLARKYGLAARKVMENRGGWKRTFLVLNKKVGAEFIIEQLEREGSWGKYELVKPPRYGITRASYLLDNPNIIIISFPYFEGIPRRIFAASI